MSWTLFWQIILLVGFVTICAGQIIDQISDKITDKEIAKSVVKKLETSTTDNLPADWPDKPNN